MLAKLRALIGAKHEAHTASWSATERWRHACTIKDHLTRQAVKAYDAGDFRTGDECMRRAREWTERCNRLWQSVCEGR